MSLTALRPVTPADVPALHALILGIEQHDRLPVASTLGEIEEWQTDPHLDLARDTRVLELDGRLVAWGRIWFRPSGEKEERAYVFGGVDGAYRGRDQMPVIEVTATAPYEDLGLLSVIGFDSIDIEVSHQQLWIGE